MAAYSLVTTFHCAFDEEEGKPCLVSDGFYCAQCLFGYVQPSYVTSNQHDNTCFRRKSLCVAEDITFSRKRHQTYCESLDGCKCNTNKCYYGDPCLCNIHTPGCPVSTSLSEDGDYMKEGKNDTNPRLNSRTLMAKAIGLAFLVLLLVIVIIVMCWRRKQCCFAQGERCSEIISIDSSEANGGKLHL